MAKKKAPPKDSEGTAATTKKSATPKKPTKPKKAGAKATAAKSASGPARKKATAKKVTAKKVTAKKVTTKKVTTKKAVKKSAGARTVAAGAPAKLKKPTPGLEALEGPVSMSFEGGPVLKAAPAEVPAAALGLIGGGSVIRGKGGSGTATIACIDNHTGSPVLSILTAAHVVGGAKGKGSNVTIGGTPIGKVTRIGSGAGIPVDVAAIELLGDAHGDVIVGGVPFPIDQIAAPVSKGLEVIHGGPHGNNGKVTGKIVALDAGPTTISLNELSKETLYDVFRMMKIAPTNGAAFGQHGDSGSPVMTKNKNSGGKHDLVGLLVAVDGDGFGYAHHMADPPGAPGVVTLMDIVPFTPETA